MELLNTKQKIFEASVELFQKKGYAGSTIREIAKAVGIKESSIYNHYKSKEEIFDCILEEFENGIISNRPSKEELEALIIAISPAEIIKLIFLNYLGNKNIKYDKIAKIIFIEQYINKKASDFFIKYMVEEPLMYYEKIFSMFVSANRIENSDYTQLTEELHYGFLCLMMEHAHMKEEEQYDRRILQKMVRHVDFVFEHIQLIG